ncbi:hypothetical protein G6F54_014069 [Rhizopus delemar]|nr:hypothetical protein G6F54_014069 [Rhizopus delemar]
MRAAQDFQVACRIDVTHDPGDGVSGHALRHALAVMAFEGVAQPRYHVGRHAQVDGHVARDFAMDQRQRHEQRLRAGI